MLCLRNKGYTGSCASSTSPARTTSIPNASLSQLPSQGRSAELFSPPSNKRLKLAGALVLIEAVGSCPGGHGLSPNILAPAGESPAA